jgi:mannitol 2-dehydrogenase
LLPLARSQHANPTAFLEDRAVFGDLIDQPRFVEAYLWALGSLHQYGAHAALEALVNHEC